MIKQTHMFKDGSDMPLWSGTTTPAMDVLRALPKSKRLQQIERHAPHVYPQPNEIERMLRESAQNEPPTARMDVHGPQALSTTELLAILLSTGNDYSLPLRIVTRFPELHKLCNVTPKEIAGLTPNRARVLLAALELGARTLTSHAADVPIIKSPGDAARIFQNEMVGLEVEQMRVLLVDTKNRVMRQALVYQGNVNTTIIRVAEIFKDAVRYNATALIIAHNHPSGDPTPSPEDVTVTQEIIKAGKLLDIEVLDHLVIGSPDRFVSLKDRGLGW